MGSEIYIDIFDDRIEISSPGGMYDGTVIKGLPEKHLSSVRRNPIIADLFGRIRYMERRGSGIEKIINEYEQAYEYSSDKQVSINSTKSKFIVTLKNLNYKDKENNGGKTVETGGKTVETGEKEKSVLKIDDYLSKQEISVLSYAENKGEIGNKDVQMLLGIKSSRAREIISKLVEKKYLVAYGATRNRVYKIKK